MCKHEACKRYYDRLAVRFCRQVSEQIVRNQHARLLRLMLLDGSGGPLEVQVASSAGRLMRHLETARRALLACRERALERVSGRRHDTDDTNTDTDTDNDNNDTLDQIVDLLTWIHGRIEQLRQRLQRRLSAASNSTAASAQVMPEQQAGRAAAAEARRSTGSQGKEAEEEQGSSAGGGGKPSGQ